MRRQLLLTLLVTILLLAFASPVYAQGEEKGQWVVITAGFAMAIAAAGCGYAQSQALRAACEGVSRNPGATDTIRIFTFLGLAFIEFLALLTFVVIMLVL